MSYATLSYARAEGVTTEQASDERLQGLLDEASATIDDVTGWWFAPRAATYRFDGAGVEVLHLPAPVIALTSVSIGDDALDLATLHTYGLVTGPRAEMRNPKLVRASSLPGYRAGRAPRWPTGRRNVTVVASLGFTKADGTSPPDAIRDACLRLALRNLPRLADAAGQSERRRGEVFRESTDGHSYEIAGALPGAVGAWRRGGLTGDPEIDVALAGYRRPSHGAVVG